jgi:uncharacterized protein YqeY
MNLRERINDDMKAAMRAKEAERLGTIRLLLAAMKQKEVDERITLDDAGIVGIIDKMIKQRKDSIAAFRQGGREDLALKEEAEVAVLQPYLPARLGGEALDAEIKAVIAEVGAASPADIGKVMGPLKARLAGKADLGAASARVKALLAQG